MCQFYWRMRILQNFCFAENIELNDIKIGVLESPGYVSLNICYTSFLEPLLPKEKQG